MVDNERLVRELKAIVGEPYVLHEPEDLLAFEYDGSIGKGLPLVVAHPASTEDVAQIVRTAARYGLPVVARGAGTGLSGGAVAEEGGVALVLTRMTKVLEIDPDNMLAVVEPGVINIDISKAVSRYGLYYAPDPASQKACTIGGNVAENAGGPHCLAYGVTTDHVLGMEVVLADGSIKWLGGKTREVPGYDLRGVVIGSEGTLAIVTKIAVRLLKRPEAVKTLLVIFRRLEDAGSAVSAIIGAGIVPAALELMDKICIEAVEPAVQAGYPKDAEAILLVELDGLTEAVEEDSSEAENICHKFDPMEVRTAANANERDRLWAGRKGVLGALGRLAPNYMLVDGTVPRTRLLEVITRIRDISDKYNIRIANLAHAGDGNLHPLILFDERDEDEMHRTEKAAGEILKVCLESGGVLSGEHGIGLDKQEYMPLTFTDEDMKAMARLQPAFATNGMFNPGKVFPSGASHLHKWRPTNVVRTRNGGNI